MTDHPAPNPNQPDALVERVARVIERETDEPMWSAIVIARAVLAAVLPEVERHAKADVLRAFAGDMGESQFYVEGTFWYEEAHRRADRIEKGDDR